LNEGDELVETQLTGAENEAVLATAMGRANRFKVSDVRAMGRNTSGVIGMRLKYEGDEVVSLAILPPSGDVQSDEENGEEEPGPEDAEETEEGVELPILLTIMENGYGKRAYAHKYRLTKRGSAGVINIKKDSLAETGKVVKLLTEVPDSEILLATQEGMVIRTPVSCIRLVNRVGKGVKVMKLNEGDMIMAIALIEGLEEGGQGSECPVDPVDGEGPDPTS